MRADLIVDREHQDRVLSLFSQATVELWIATATLSAKADGRRNFEMGILTTYEHAIERAQGRFDAIWSGKECGACKLRHVCPAPLDRIGGTTSRESSTPASRSPASPSRPSSRRRSA